MRTTGVQLNAAVAMSNHTHLVVHDPEGRLPEFLERFHRITARCLNATFGRTENFWASEQTNVVELLTYEAIIDKVAYVAANPVRAGLVRSPHKWPGLLLSRFNEKRVVTRPKFFFREDGPMPETVTLETTRPDIFEGATDEQLQDVVDDAIASLVRKARATMKDEGRAFLGAKAVLKQSPFRAAVTPERIGRRKPRFAASNTSVLVGAIAAWRRFIAAYRAAFMEWRAGSRERVFPHGTYKLRRMACVRCAGLDGG